MSKLYYVGVVYNKITGELWRTSRYSNYKDAHDMAEELMERRSVPDNCSINVETYDKHGLLAGV